MTVLAYHPMGGRIACGCNQGMIRIYSTVSGRLLHLRDTTGGAAALDGGGVGGGVGGGISGVMSVEMRSNVVRGGGGGGGERRATGMGEEDEEAVEEEEEEEEDLEERREGMVISAIEFSSTGRYLGVSRRDGKTMILDGWGEWCRGVVMAPPCLNPFTSHAEGVVTFVRRPALPRHSVSVVCCC